MARGKDPGGWLPYSLSEWYFDRTQGSKASHRMDVIYVDRNEKPKKARRAFLSFLGGSKAKRVTEDPIMRGVLGGIQEDIIRRDEWRRDQGGAQIGRGGWGQAFPEVDPGPGPGFLETPQVFGSAPGGYYDQNGMWHDEGR